MIDFSGLTCDLAYKASTEKIEALIAPSSATHMYPNNTPSSRIPGNETCLSSNKVETDNFY